MGRFTDAAHFASQDGGEGLNAAELASSIHAFLPGLGVDGERILAEFPGVLYECDEALSVTFVSANSYELVGVEPQQLLGSEGLWGRRLFPRDRAPLMALLESLAPGVVGSATHRVLDQRELPVWVSHSFRKMPTKSGKVLRGCMVPLPKDNCTQDIAPTIVPQFVHKIGNHFQLLNLLMGNLRRSGLAKGEMDSLQQALDDTVDFTRTFSNYAQGPSCQSEYELSEVLNGVMHTLSPIFAEKNVSLKFVEGEIGGVFLLGDPYLLEVGLTAILQNSLDATSAGGNVKMTARCQGHQPSHDMSAQIVIEDTGSGMDGETLARALDPFFTSRRDRSGLGLSMASRIIEQHGGILRLSSLAGHGTQVDIRLPSYTPPKLLADSVK